MCFILVIIRQPKLIRTWGASSSPEIISSRFTIDPKLKSIPEIPKFEISQKRHFQSSHSWWTDTFPLVNLDMDFNSEGDYNSSLLFTIESRVLCRHEVNISKETSTKPILVVNDPTKVVYLDYRITGSSRANEVRITKFTAHYHFIGVINNNN